MRRRRCHRHRWKKEPPSSKRVSPWDGVYGGRERERESETDGGLDRDKETEKKTERGRKREKKKA